MNEAIFNFLSIDSWTEFWWVVLGLTAQFAFSMRFIVQWIASERAGRSYVPVEFWYLSIVGGAMLLSYAIYRQDVVFILGQSMGLIVYVRNLVLIRRGRRADRIAAAAAAAEAEDADAVHRARAAAAARD
ncbi:MAG: lipid-A-disaccharide synthase N-terminal domain-containing protein [Roseicyclus sp.]